VALAHPSAGRTGRGSRPRGIARALPARLPLIVFAVLMVVAAIVVMHGGRNTTFFFDDWNFVTQRIDWRPYTLLYPHNEHLSLLPVLVYKFLLETVGMDSYGVFRAVSVGFNLTCGLLFFLYLRRRIGDWPAVALATCLMVMGAAAYDLIWPFQIGYLGSLATGLGALLALDRGTRRGDIIACVLTVASLSSSSVGLPVVVGVAVDVLFRPNRGRRLWVFLIPAILYALWYVKYGVGTADLANIPHIPAEIWGGLAVSTTALTGLSTDYSGALALALIVAVIAEIGRRDGFNVRLLAVVALPVTFWSLAAIARSGLSPSEARYLYPTGLFVGLVAADALWRFRPTGRASVAIAAVLGAGALGSAAGINPYGDNWRSYAVGTKASITAADLLGPTRIGPDVLVDPTQVQLPYGRYRTAVEAYGSTPGWTAEEVPGRSDNERTAVDAALVRLAAPSAAKSARPQGATCSHRLGNGKDRVIRMDGGRFFLQSGSAPVEIRFRRFGSTFPKDAEAALEARGHGVVSVPHDLSRATWLAATRSPAPYLVCNLP
jgi:hypothetical protein